MSNRLLYNIETIVNQLNSVEDDRDITIVLNKPDMTEFIKLIDRDRYSNVMIQYEGDYFYISSSIQLSELFVENVRTEQGILTHSTDLLILPHYVPHDIVSACECEEVVILKDTL